MEVTVCLEHAMSMCYLESIVLLVGTSSINDTQVELVHVRSQPRLGTDQRHGLRRMHSGFHASGSAHCTVRVIVTLELSTLVEGHQYAQLPSFRVLLTGD